MFWRVVTCPTPLPAHFSATSANVSSCLTVGQPVGKLHANHEDALLALAVGAVDEAEGAPLVGRDVAVLEPLEHVDEGVDVLALGETGTAHAVGNEVNDWIRAHS